MKYLRQRKSKKKQTNNGILLEYVFKHLTAKRWIKAEKKE